MSSKYSLAGSSSPQYYLLRTWKWQPAVSQETHPQMLGNCIHVSVYFFSVDNCMVAVSQETHPQILGNCIHVSVYFISVDIWMVAVSQETQQQILGNCIHVSVYFFSVGNCMVAVSQETRSQNRETGYLPFLHFICHFPGNSPLNHKKLHLCIFIS